MSARLPRLCATLAFAAAFVACQDSSTAPRHGTAVRTPSFLTTSDPSGGSASQFHFVANGDQGFVEWFSIDGGGFTFGELAVNRGGSVNNPQTFLFYFAEQCDIFFNCTFADGDGFIPNGDLSKQSDKALHLSTNTTGNPNFFTFDGPTGLISVDWKANGFFQSRNSGTFEQDVPGFRFLSNGVFTSASANATGSVVGFAISPDNFGNIGTNHNVFIDIFH